MSAARTGPTPPGGVLGVVGGGQLGRMLALAAARLGLKTAVYAPEAEGPAQSVAAWSTVGAFEDVEALSAFARRVDVVTYEFENAPAGPLAAVDRITPVRPHPRALEAAQDRLVEKTRLNAIGVPTAPFAPVDGPKALAARLADPEGPAEAFLKTRRFGYDGKGQARLSGRLPAAHAADAAARAWAAIGAAPAILETRVDFARELSVIAARSLDGRVHCYDPAENAHENGVLRRSIAPARCAPERARQAQDIAARLAEALDYVGVLGLELFDPGGDAPLIANEFAPRVHNTGHWTLEACAVSQFEQHVRAVCGWPLGDPARHSDAEMINLLGDEAEDWRRLAAEPGAALHLYDKGAPQPGRKMGHVTRLLGPARRG